MTIATGSIPSPSRFARHLAAALVSLALLLGVIAPAAAQEATPGATPGATPAASPVASVPGLGGIDIAAAAAALIAVQGADGGFIGFSGESDPGVTTDAVMALAAADAAGVDTAVAIDAALGYLETTGSAYAESGDGQRAKLVLAVEAAGDDSADFGGADVWAPIEDADYSGGLVGTGTFDLSLVLLAATTVDSERTDEFITLLTAAQLDDGAWGYLPDAVVGDGDTNTTALAIQALVAAGDVEDPAIEAGLAYLDTARAADGGYAYAPNADGSPVFADANSTALVIQARLATLTPTDDPALTEDAAALAGLQNASGQFRFTADAPDDNLFATVQALPAAAALPFPLAA